MLQQVRQLRLEFACDTRSAAQLTSARRAAVPFHSALTSAHLSSCTATSTSIAIASATATATATSQLDFDFDFHFT